MGEALYVFLEVDLYDCMRGFDLGDFYLGSWSLRYRWGADLYHFGGERDIPLWFCLAPRKQVCDPDEWIHHLNSMRSESGMISCMIAWFTYISVVPLPCYRTLNVVGAFPAFVTELDLDLSLGGTCIQKDCTQERYISEISYWRFWGMASKSKILLIDLLFCIFMHSYWGICYAWQSWLMGWNGRILGDSV